MNEKLSPTIICEAGNKGSEKPTGYQKTMSNQPKYYRLLEKGEKIEKCDKYVSDLDNQMHDTDHAGDQVGRVNLYSYFRPVQVDEWQEYAKVKPTKEDFRPYGYVEVLLGGIFGNTAAHGMFGFTDDTVTHWRRITPPELPKPKSVDVKIGCKTVRIHENGSVDIPIDVHRAST